MKMKKWLDITLDILCVMYYFDFIIICLFIAVSVVTAKPLNPIHIIIMLVGIGITVHLGCLLVRIIYMNTKKMNRRKESLKFKMMTLTIVLLKMGNPFPTILILLINRVTSHGFSRLLHNNPTLTLVISLIGYVCIECYLLKEYKDKRGAPDKIQSDE